MTAHELRTAWRRLLAQPLHSALSTGILSLGLLAALFLFGAVNSIVLRPLPFPDADRLVTVGWTKPAEGTYVRTMTGGDWRLLSASLDMFDRIAMDSGPATINLTREQGTTRYNGAMIDHHLLPILGVQPLLGRAFGVEEDQPGAAATILLGERVWRNEFDADPAVIGRSLRANGETATVIGVMPANFAYPIDQQVWLPRRFGSDDQLTVHLIARLAPGVSLEQARQSLAALGERMGSQLSGAQHDYELGMYPLSHRFVNDVTRRMVWMMFAAGVLVLVLACANVANLQLSSVLMRRRELAVRSALGAGRARLLRDLLAEALVMSLFATVIAIAANHYLSQLLFQSMVANENAPPFYISFDYDWRDYAIVPLVSVLTCLLAGLIPALRAAGTDVQDALRDGSKGSHGGIFARISRGLVVAEIALTVVLLVGAAMFVRGISGMVNFDTGSDTDPNTVLTARIGLFANQYPTGADQVQFFERVVERLREQPQVIAASAGTGIPGAAGNGDDTIVAEGDAKPAGGYLRADHAFVDAGFLDVYGLRLREGRFFDGRDRADSEPVVVIDRRVAQRLWPQRPALGQRMLLDVESAQPKVLTVIGVVDDLHLRQLDSRLLPALLLPLPQAPVRFATVAMRLHGDAMAFAPALSEAVRSIDPEVPAYWLRTQAEAVRLGWVGPALLTQIFTGVGVLALMLAAAGLYGVLSFSVEQRTREIGIRRAIGSGRADVAGLVFRRIGWQLALGLAIGVALGLPWSAALANPALNLYAYDPMIFGSIIAVIVVVAVLAALAPLRRALRVDPIIALRHE